MYSNRFAWDTFLESGILAYFCPVKLRKFVEGHLQLTIEIVRMLTRTPCSESRNKARNDNYRTPFPRNRVSEELQAGNFLTTKVTKH